MNDQIHTLDALNALPVDSVVLETSERIAYQKISADSWSGDVRQWRSRQISLPVTVLWLPVVVEAHEHVWVGQRALCAAEWTEVCECGATRVETMEAGL